MSEKGDTLAVVALFLAMFGFIFTPLGFLYPIFFFVGLSSFTMTLVSMLATTYYDARDDC